MKYQVFISYSRKDAATAELVCKEFDKVGITYFIDNDSIHAAEDFPEVISSAIKDSELFLLLASENAYKSIFTRKEVVFAVNNVPNAAILPYIIDNSSLPSDLEFLFSNVNWITIKSHPIESGLVPEILRVLDGPEAVKLRKRKKRLPVLVFSLLLALALVVFIPLLIDSAHKRASEAEAKKNSTECLAMIHAADSYVDDARHVCDSNDPASCAEAEIGGYKTADSLYKAAAAIQKAGKATPYYYMFDMSEEIDAKRAFVREKLDSISSFWKERALDSNGLYRSGLGGDAEREDALRFIGFALMVKPDQELESMKQYLR